MKAEDAQALKECSDMCGDLIESTKLGLLQKYREKVK